MAIIDMFKVEKKENITSGEGFLTDVSFVEEESFSSDKDPKKTFWKDAFLSFVCVRLFFLVLLCCTVVWFAYSTCKTAIYFLLKLCFWGSSNLLNTNSSKSWLSLKRSFICGIALLLALLTPALGIMIACTYFLMYDKSGIEEVVPSSLREQFKDLFSQGAVN